jgi:hypothetical protein
VYSGIGEELGEVTAGAVWETLKRSGLGALGADFQVSLEVDVLAKYGERLSGKCFTAEKAQWQL